MERIKTNDKPQNLNLLTYFLNIINKQYALP